jgi:hypothetical protein
LRAIGLATNEPIYLILSFESFFPSLILFGAKRDCAIFAFVGSVFARVKFSYLYFSETTPCFTASSSVRLSTDEAEEDRHNLAVPSPSLSLSSVFYFI